MRYVYAFDEGSKDQKDLLGGKGANLAEMTSLGLPVPPGFTITTEACRAYRSLGHAPEGLGTELREHLGRLEADGGRRLGDATEPLLLSVRRAAIVGVLLLGYLYFHLAGEAYALVSIGLISFAAVAQFAPAALGGMYWKGGTQRGALPGLLAGFALWAYTLMLPSIAKSGWWPDAFLHHGPWGMALLKPEALFGLEAHPMVGQTPLLLKLTSPAGRPIQATRDLPGFWRGSWAEVKKEMKGRYPKHRWPDEPWAEKPSLKTKNAFARSNPE